MEPGQPPDPNANPYAGEDTKSGTPQSVSGAYLADGAEPSSSGAKTMTFDKVVQGTSDTCAFDSTLSAVALSNFDLAAGITIASKKSATDYVYNVRLFEPAPGGGYKAVIVPEDFNGTINPSDASSTDPNEFWPTLFQRAYLSLESSLGQDYHLATNAFEALTGQSASELKIASGAVTAGWIEQTLDAGTPIVAGTGPSSDPYHVDPAQGIFGDHDYTVVGIGRYPSGEIDVTLRNPWGLDTDPSFYNNFANSPLTEQQFIQFYQGLDGANDGIIRVSLATFDKYFSFVDVSRLTGPSINSPQASDPPPAFNHPTNGPFTVYECDTVGPIDASAADTEGRSVSYSVVNGSPGSVDTNGSYTWVAPPGSSGTYNITVAAESATGETSMETFEVIVRATKPTVAAVSASPTSVDDTGTGLVTLTATGVTSSDGPVNEVQFYLDSPGEGVFDSNNDLFVGSATSADNWTWTGSLGGVSDGSYKVFAVADQVRNLFTVFGPAASTTIRITPGPPYSVVAIPWTDQKQVGPTMTYDQVSLGVTEDASGDTRVFWFDPSPNGGVFVREYNAFGDPLSDPRPLIDAGSVSFVGLPDGSFDEVFMASNELIVQRYDSSANTVGSLIYVASNPLVGAFELPTTISAAADANGDLLIAYEVGQFYPDHEQILFAATVSSAGAVTGITQLNLYTQDNQASLVAAMNSSGNGVVAWVDTSLDVVVARKVSSAGLVVGPDFTVYQDPSVVTVSAAIDSAGDFTLAYDGHGGIHASSYSGDGTSDSGDFVVFGQYNSIQSAPLVAMTSEGWSVVAWNNSAAAPNGGSLDAQVYDPQLRTQGTPFLIPNVDLSSTLGGLAFGNDGKIAVEFVQPDLTYSIPVADFRLYKVDQEPIFSGATQFTAAIGSAAGTVVGTVQATSPSGDSIYYRLLGNSPFAIDPQSGAITVADPTALQSTSVANYQLTVQADVSNPNANLIPAESVVIKIVEGTPLSIDPMPDRVVDQRGSFAAAIFANDANGTRLTYSATAVPLAYWLKQTYGLYANPSGYNTNLRGGGEKYLLGTSSANGYNTGGQPAGYYLLPDGDLYELTPPFGTALSGVLVASLGPAVYNDPTLLISASPTAVPATLSVLGNEVFVVPDPDYVGAFGVLTTASDGLTTASAGFRVNVVTLVLAPLADHVVGSDPASQSVVLSASDPSGAPLSYMATAEPLPYWLEQTYGLSVDPSGYNLNQRGANEKYLRGTVSANGYNTGGQPSWYYLLPDGSLYELTPGFGAALSGQFVANLGPAVYANPTLLTAATQSAIPVALSIANNVLSTVPNTGYTGTFVIVASASNGLDAVSRSFRVSVPQALTITPTVTWAKPADITFGTVLGAAQLDATASVAGVFTYTPAAGTLLQAGAGRTLAVTFTPTDTTDYSPVTVYTHINVVLPPPVTVIGVMIETVHLTRKKTATDIVVTFSGGLNSRAAGLIGNYHLAAPGKGKKSKTYTKPIGLTSALYATGMNEVTLQVTGKLVSSPAPQLRITAAGVVDNFGRSLDGNNDGQPGGDYVALLTKGGAQPQVVRAAEAFARPSPRFASRLMIHN